VRDVGADALDRGLDIRRGARAAAHAERSIPASAVAKERRAFLSAAG
jgi:hypothetical protein